MPVGAVTQGTNTGDAAAWHALMRDKSLQLQFPDADLNARLPGWLTRLFEFLGRHGSAFSWAGWIVLGIVVVLILWFGIRWFRGRDLSQGSTPAPRQMTPWQPSARQARLLLHDADGLAAQGRFDEAVHRLLLVSIQEITDRQQGLVTPALTSREIARLASLSALAQQIFSGIAQVVEHSRFGGHAIGAAEYQLCRTAFDKFAQPDTWRMAA